MTFDNSPFFKFFLLIFLYLGLLSLTTWIQRQKERRGIGFHLFFLFITSFTYVFWFYILFSRFCLRNEHKNEMWCKNREAVTIRNKKMIGDGDLNDLYIFPVFIC